LMAAGKKVRSERIFNLVKNIFLPFSLSQFGLI
jgi:hypothetical protein